ncbi:RNA polymerase II basal transcription complex subunit, putative [Candida dubliniensis CD36]|uniref:Mediator of RNA polymerase II transcription subunit 10 n=1 Tax=Candida dubliniensis (strain CD36 / ATCC MYA-646 / CBS 7987 / NCPF 3949 / NRRL Y-17841) TaxID=573826 RepID=B9W9J3_CANDC|nr:RNA polymerase II basal transcription complex subunit, putative [Candida dubliniensis CD36]CAX45476.1 RNA polymerase II basal transcription complex subunit, putative [Candida dubliniensis CD36]
MTTGTLPSTPENEPLIKSADNVANLIESFIELGVLVHDNQGTPQSNQALMNKLNQLIQQLSQTSTIANDTNTNTNLKQFLIPIDVISYIEDGRNPDIYTREFIEVNAKSNARLKGKMLGFKKLRDVFSDKLKQEFPQLEKSVDDIIKRTDDN